MTRPVVYSRLARQDLRDVFDYIAAENPAAAYRFVDMLEETCALFGKHPDMGTREMGYSTEIRSFSRGTYVIFYRLIANQIEIVRVLHGARNRTGLIE